VNARVDERIAPLVLAINELPGVLTVDSCERGKNGSAYVYFVLDTPSPCRLARFCARLASLLHGVATGNDGYALRLEWRYDFGAAMARMEAPPDGVAALASALHAAARKLRRSPYACGKSRRGPHNSRSHPNRQISRIGCGGTRRPGG